MHDLVLITYNGKEYRCYTLNRESYNAGSFSHNYSESKKWDILRCEVFNGASTTLSDVPEDTLLNITIEIPRGEIEGTGCHGEGYNNTIYAEAEYSHAEGVANVITGSGTHVEGSSNIGSGDYSFTTGLSNHTVGIGGITLGTDNYNAGTCGITIGHTLYTNSAQSIILGQFNVPNAYNDEAVLIVGNGYGKTPHGYENYQHDALVIKKGSSSDIIIGDSIVFTSGSTILTLGNTGASLRIGSTTLTLNETKLKKLITLLS